MTERLENRPPGDSIGSVLTSPADVTLDRPVELSGTVGLEQFLRIHRLTVTKLDVWQVLKALCAVGLMFGVVAAFGLFARQPVWMTLFSLGGFVVFLVGIASFFSLHQYRSSERAVRRAFRSGALQPLSAAWTISDEGLSSVTEAVTSRMKWEAYGSIREGEDMILLYDRNATSAIPLVREFCTSDDDWDRLRRFLRSKFPVNPQSVPSKSP